MAGADAAGKRAHLVGDEVAGRHGDAPAPGAAHQFRGLLGTRPALVRLTLLHAWDKLRARTLELAAPQTSSVANRVNEALLPAQRLPGGTVAGFRWSGGTRSAPVPTSP